MSEFIVGIPRCNELNPLFESTLVSVWRSSRRPARLIVIDNGDVPLMRPSSFDRARGIDVIRPERNVGCAGAWNLIHKLSAPLPTIIINADLQVATDTFERMLAVPAPAAICAFGFGCFRIDEDIRRRIGDFDEEFYPVYWEDTDYRYRLKLAGIELDEWPIDSDEVGPGRKLSRTGITHGKHEDGAYQGWRDEKLKWFQSCLEKNRQRYIAKWGGGHTQETFTIPFGGAPGATR